MDSEFEPEVKRPRLDAEHLQNSYANEDDDDVDEQKDDKSIKDEQHNNLDENHASDNDVEQKFDEQQNDEEDDNKIKEQLRHFDILDEVQGDGSGSEVSGEDESSATDVDDEEIENMLDEGLPDDFRVTKKRNLEYAERYKTILIEKGRNHFDILPEGWVQITHNSGMPLFLHKPTRVCTLSRPYFLGPGSVRKHEIPLSAIPCLNYRKAMERESQLRTEHERHMQEIKNNSFTTTNDELVNGTDIVTNEPNDQQQIQPSNSTINHGTECPMENRSSQLQNVLNSIQPQSQQHLSNSVPNLNLLKIAKIETIKENTKAYSLTADELTEYCKKLFLFKSVRVMKFRSWSARRKFTKSKRQIKNLQRPTLPDDTKLITFPVINIGNSHQKREWIMNPNGKSFVCILHEYVQFVLKRQPTYTFRELENAATPYSATVSISDLKYGTGYGTSKKQAKSNAARETIEVLLPGLVDEISCDKSNGQKKELNKKLSIFDEIRIEDPRVFQFSTKTTEPPPYAILLICLQRNFGLGMKIEDQVHSSKQKRNEYTMTVGKHTATVRCKNKNDGKQLASQAILQLIHPYIRTWGSLLRLYGSHSVKTYKEKKQEEQEITGLQSKAAINQPNYAILDKLKTEMRKLQELRDSIKPIGSFIAPVDVDLPTASSSNLNIVEL